jgi:hypothetical protein
MRPADGTSFRPAHVNNALSPRRLTAPDAAGILIGLESS